MAHIKRVDEMETAYALGSDTYRKGAQADHYNEYSQETIRTALELVNARKKKLQVVYKAAGISMKAVYSQIIYEFPYNDGTCVLDLGISVYTLKNSGSIGFSKFDKFADGAVLEAVDTENGECVEIKLI